MRPVKTFLAAACAAAMWARADVSITATPGMDYEGSTVAASGGAFDSGLLTVGTNSYVLSGSTFTIPAEDLEAGVVKTATVVLSNGTECVHSGTIRLVQGADRYVACTNEVGQWFDEIATDLGRTGAWTNQGAVVEQAMVLSYDDDDDPARFAPSNQAQSAAIAIVEAEVSFGAAMEDDAIPTGVQAGIRLVLDDDDDCHFACLADGGWVTNFSYVGYAETGYVVRISADYATSNAVYEIRKSGEAEFTTLVSGAFDGDFMRAVTFGGAGMMAYVKGADGEEGAHAYLCRSGENKYLAINDAIADGKTSLELLWDSSWYAEEEEPTAVSIAGTRALKVTGGKINATALPATTTLVGGKYTLEGTNSWNVYKADGYRFASCAALDDYVYEIIEGDEPVAADEKVYPTTGGDIAFSKDDLINRGIGITEKSTDAEIAAALNETGANNNPVWENVALGLSNTDKNAQPVVLPVQTQDPSSITFSLGNVAVNEKTSAKVTYKVYMSNEPGGKDGMVSSATAPDETVAMPLPDSGVKYYVIEVDTTGAM